MIRKLQGPARDAALGWPLIAKDPHVHTLIHSSSLLSWASTRAVGLVLVFSGTGTVRVRQLHRGHLRDPGHPTEAERNQIRDQATSPRQLWKLVLTCAQQMWVGRIDVGTNRQGLSQPPASPSLAS